MIRMEIVDNKIPVFGQADDRTLNQIRVCARTADKVALMPDNHVGYGVPIGGVVAYKNAISPTGVGYDIGCGNKPFVSICLARSCAHGLPRSWMMFGRQSASVSVAKTTRG